MARYLLPLRSLRSLALVGALLCLTGASGCGSSGPKRYRVEGTVTYAGQPVPGGRVIFEPATDQGNNGPAAYADIRQGRYATLEGLGTVGGPHVLRVICLSGQPEGAELAEGRMVCPEFRQAVDLPRSHCEHAIEVPDSHKW